MPTLSSWLMIAPGAGLIVLGIIILLRARRRVTMDRWQAAQIELDAERAAPRVRRDAWSFASHAAFGLSLMGAGYHLIAWALPSHTLLAVPATMWYIVPLAGTLMVVLSRSLDRLESRESQDASRE